MKHVLILFVIAAFAQQSQAQLTDSSSIVFDVTTVHDYKLTFYVADYEDALVYNYENGEEYMPARLEYNGMVFDSIGVRYKGNSSYMMSRGTPKKPFKFKFNEYRDEQRLYGMKKLNFSNCVKDPSFLREMFAYGIIRQYLPASRTAYATITVNGELLGLYVSVEQVDKTFLEKHFEDNDFNLYKAGDNGGTLEYRGENKASYRAEYELQTNEDEDDWSRMIEMIRLLNLTTDENFIAEVDPWIDFTGALRLLAFNMVLSNFDSYSGSGRNFYLYDEEISGRFSILPWDLNEAFGAYHNNWDVITQDVLSMSNLDKRPLNRRLLADESLRQVYLGFIREMLDGSASCNTLAAKAGAYRTLIDQYVLADKYKLYTYQNFLDNLEHDVLVGLNENIPGILSFIGDRTAELRSQLGVYTGIESPLAVVTEHMADVELWPNPSAGNTGIQYHLASAGSVTLIVRDMLGRELRSIDFGSQLPGRYYNNVALRGLPAGTYFYQLMLLGNDANTFSGQLLKLQIVY